MAGAIMAAGITVGITAGFLEAGITAGGIMPRAVRSGWAHAAGPQLTMRVVMATTNGVTALAGTIAAIIGIAARRLDFTQASSNIRGRLNRRPLHV
jgi:hypothetical protein